MLTEIQFDHKLVAQLFDLQPDAVVWYAPVFDEQEIIDFEYRYCNAAAARMFGVPVTEVTGTPLRDCSFIDEITRKYIFQQCLSVFKGGQPVEFTYYSPVFQRYLNVQRSKAVDGILSITRDRTTQVIAEKERERQSNLLTSINNASPTGIALFEAIYDSTSISDFRFLMVNNRISENAGRAKNEIEMTTLCDVDTSAENSGLLNILRNAIVTGQPSRSEIFLETFGGWFLLTTTKIDDNQVLAIFLEINEARKDKVALEEQAEWYNNILSHSPSGIIALRSIRDKKGEIVDFEIRLANKAGKLMGSLPPDPVGKRILEIFPHFVENGYFEFHKQVVETGIPYCHDVSFGSEGTWFQLSLAKHEDGLISNFTDISEIKYFESAIKSQANELKSIFDASLNGVFACEAVRNTNGTITDFRILKINTAFEQILGLEKKDVIGRLFSEVFPSSKDTGLLHIHVSVVETGEPFQGEQYYKDQAIEGWFLISVNKWGDNGFVQTFFDYTRLKHLQQQLELTIQGLKRSNERLTEFSHVASHDLNEPLRKVITFSKLLNDKYGNALDSGAKDYLDRIEKTAVRMQVLLENLLVYSRVSKQINSFDQVRLGSVVQDVLSDLETLISQRDAIIRADDLPTITGEKTQLRQLFQNLLTNAIKFQVAGSQPVITIRYAGTRSSPSPDFNNKDFHLIEISDNGIGFDPSESEKIFHLFHRLHARHEYEGTGIGLAIVQRAMENHNGFAEATSEPGRGSTFRLYFPK